MWRADFERAVFSPYRAALRPFLASASFPSLEAWNAAFPEVITRGGARVRFVDQPRPRRRGEPVDVASLYDERIFVRGEVPSRRDNWHDFFNMLVWATFPRLKVAINARQRAALRARIEPGMQKLPGARTPEQDALAMLDEGGLLMVRERPLLIGHAILEHLMIGTGEVRALVFAVDLDPASELHVVDAEAARLLDEGHPIVLPHAPPGLPVNDALFAATFR